MNKDVHLIFEAFASKGVHIAITDHIEEDEIFSIKTTVKKFDAAHVAQAFVKHAYGKYDQERVAPALQSVLDSMQVNPYGAKKGVIELHINEFAGDGMNHHVEAKIIGQEENAEHGHAQRIITSELHKVHTILNQLSTMIDLNRSAETDQLLSKIRDASEMLMTDSPAENAEQYEQNRIVGNTVMQDDQEIGVFLGDSYSSKLTLHGKDMFMPGAPYAQTVNQGTHMGLWYKNKRHKLIVKDASKWKEFLSDIVSTGDDKYWDGKKMHQHDHMGDKIAADDAHWSKKIAAGADQRAENAEGRSNAQHAAIAISLQKAGKKKK